MGDRNRTLDSQKSAPREGSLQVILGQASNLPVSEDAMTACQVDFGDAEGLTAPMRGPNPFFNSSIPLEYDGEIILTIKIIDPDSEETLASQDVDIRPVLRERQWKTVVQLRPAGQIEMQMEFMEAPHNPPPKLSVQINRGIDLTNQDVGKDMDPYVEVALISPDGETAAKKTRVIKRGGTNPVWEEILEFDYHNEQQICFRVKDHDTFSKDDLVGEATHILWTILKHGNTRRGNLSLIKDGRIQGKLNVQFEFWDPAERIKPDFIPISTESENGLTNAMGDEEDLEPSPRRQSSSASSDYRGHDDSSAGEAESAADRQADIAADHARAAREAAKDAKKAVANNDFPVSAETDIAAEQAHKQAKGANAAADAARDAAERARRARHPQEAANEAAEKAKEAKKCADNARRAANTALKGAADDAAKRAKGLAKDAARITQNAGKKVAEFNNPEANKLVDQARAAAERAAEEATAAQEAAKRCKKAKKEDEIKKELKAAEEAARRTKKLAEEATKLAKDAYKAALLQKKREQRKAEKMAEKVKQRQKEREMQQARGRRRIDEQEAARYRNGGLNPHEDQMFQAAAANNYHGDRGGSYDADGQRSRGGGLLDPCMGGKGGVPQMDDENAPCCMCCGVGCWGKAPLLPAKGGSDAR